MVALHEASNSLIRPLGSLTLTLSPVLLSTIAEFPPDLANFPPSPGLDSTFEIGVPSGILPRIVTLPGLRSTLSPNETGCPMEIPSGAAICPSVPSSNFILANGAVWAGLWISPTISPISSFTLGRTFAAGNR